MTKLVKIVRLNYDPMWLDQAKRAFTNEDDLKVVDNVTAAICDFISTFARFEKNDDSVSFYLLKKKIRSAKKDIFVDEADITVFLNAANAALKTLNEIPAASEGKLNLPLSALDFDKLNAVIYEFNAAETVREK